MARTAWEKKKEGQHVYGPSLANVEQTIVETNGMGAHGMGGKKNGDKWYGWDHNEASIGPWSFQGDIQVPDPPLFCYRQCSLVGANTPDLMPQVRFPDAVVRRAVAHCPSHRRYLHPLWIDSFSLIADLLLGRGVGRYLGCLQDPAFKQAVELRGFSAGSFAGLCLLHILWPIPGVTTKGRLGAIACPPVLLTMGPAKEGDKLHLIHYESDELCCWKPGREQLENCCTRFTYIMNESSAYKGHFGAGDHGYSHWLGLELPVGILQLSQLLFLCPEAAASAKRDETPLRLISWLNYQLDSDIESFIEKAMHHLSTREHHDGSALLQLGKQQVKLSDQVRTD